MQNYRKGKKGELGNANPGGICHSWSDDGRCISLLKILFTNDCIYNCVYCINRCTNQLPRATFTPEEVVELTMNFYKRNYIEALFLSSAVYKNPNYTMELLEKTVKKLRLEEQFNGYIHLKAIPGADKEIIERAGFYVDRMSVNIELPSSEGLKALTPQKNKESILKSMNFINSRMSQSFEEIKRFKYAEKFVPAGQTTQLIVGATRNNDLKILKLSEGLYKEYKLKRVYYSAYVPISNNPNLPAIISPPFVRENRLYQADWLLRFYGYNADELLDENKPNFDLEIDPECDWALRNINLFPIEINKANYSTLLRIPGVGVRSAMRIISARKFCSLDFDHIKKLGVVLKRAKYFVTCKGKYYGLSNMDGESIRRDLTLEIKNKTQPNNIDQLSLFSMYPNLILDNKTKVLGEF